MGYQQIGDANKKTVSVPVPRLAFECHGDGEHLLKDVKAGKAQFKSILTIGPVQISSTDNELVIDSTSLSTKQETLDAISHWVSGSLETRDRELEELREVQKDQSKLQYFFTLRIDKVIERLMQLEEAMQKGLELPDNLKSLSELATFHGSIPVVENGEWKALNLSNDFFQKYESKILAQNGKLESFNEVSKNRLDFQIIAINKLESQVKTLKRGILCLSLFTAAALSSALYLLFV